MPAAYVLVLTAAPGSGAITEHHAREIRSLTPGPDTVDQRWLAPGGDAWEQRFSAKSEMDGAAMKAVAEEVVAGLPVDVNVVADADRRKRLLAADMESTIIAQELIDEMAALIGCHAEISAITAAAMRGEIDFEASLRRRVALFAGLEVGRLDPLRARITAMPGAATLVGTMRANGARCVLISGGFTLFAEEVAARFGFETVVANVLDIEGGRLTGRVREPIVGPQGKADALARLAAACGVPRAETVSVGDGANDVAMLTAAGLGVAFRAKPMLIAHAQGLANGAVVTHGDLTALLHLQGYARGDFAA